MEAARFIDICNKTFVLFVLFAHPIDFFCLTNFEKNTNLSWFLFGMIPGVDSYSRHFGIINK